MELIYARLEGPFLLAKQSDVHNSRININLHKDPAGPFNNC